MAKRLERWTFNPEALSSCAALTAGWFVLGNPEFKYLATLLISQLIRLLPVRNLKRIMFYLKYCFIIPEQAHEGSR